MQNVWRAENTQKGRYREFLQVDADIVGSYSPLADAEIIAIANTCLKVLGFKKYLINVNTRELLFRKLKEEGIEDGLLSKVIIIIDKVDKIGWPKMDQALLDLGIPEEKVRSLNTTLSVTQRIEQEPYLKSILDACEKMGITNIQSKLYLARGLDYYTGLIFEVEVEGYDAGSIAGGGRYNNLIGMFAEKDIPAVGFAFGFDRLMEAMESLNLFPKNLRANDILVAFSTSDLQEKSLKISNQLRNKNLNAEIYLEDVTLEKQLKYADKKGIPYVLIVNKDNLILKNMTDGNQKEITLENLPDEFK